MGHSSCLMNKFKPEQIIRSISAPVIVGKILHVITLETRKWDAVLKKPTGELVTNYIYVTISVATGHRHDVGEEDAILV